MTNAVIRLARPDDADSLGALGRQTFVDTFDTGFGIPYPAADLEAFLDASFAPEASLKRIVDPDCALWVADRDGELLAFANVGPCTLPHPEARPSHMELRRLYVAKAAQGLGLGTKLLALSLDWMQARSDGPLWIGVWSENYGAQRFYARHGFEIVGDYSFMVGDHADYELITRRPAQATR